MTIDPSHWLHRLTPDDWMRAAIGEYEASVRALTEKRHRQGVSLARRAAGMGLNAVLCIAPDETWGRSYMEHLSAAKDAPSVPAPVREAIQSLVDASLDAPALVRLGPGDPGAAKAALTVLEWCASRIG